MMIDVVQGNNRFAFELLRRLGERPGNLAFSPYSISAALAMTSAGAGGLTLREMVETLHLPPDPATLDSGFAALRESVGGEGRERPYRLLTADALWGRQGVDYLPEFLGRTLEAFGASLRPVDFAGDPAGTLREINAWVEDRTSGKIKDLLGPGAVGERTDLVLTDAIYFRAAWASPFSESATRDETFAAEPSPIEVPMMHLTRSFGYLEADGFQAVGLDYLGSEVSMVVLLPGERDGLAGLEARLTADRVAGWLTGLAPREVALTIPRFKLEGSAGLARVLASMGMASAFGPEADFSGLASDRRLLLSSVVHRATVEVDEEGTEAAAATAVVMATMSLRRPVAEPPVVFRADRPFLFLIRHRPSGSILFLGRVADPRG